MDNLAFPVQTFTNSNISIDLHLWELLTKSSEEKVIRYLALVGYNGY